MSEVQPVQPSDPAWASRTPAGWYPDGSGQLAWWDGAAWTEHRAPVPQQQVYAQQMPQPMPSMMVTSVPKKTSHTFHLLMSLVTCGLWLPVWWLVAVLNRVGKDKHVTKIR